MTEQRIIPLLRQVAMSEEASEGAGSQIALPLGTVTLLLADVEGSTKLLESEPQSVSKAVIVHDRLVEDAIGRNNGVKPKDQGEGDSFVAAFSRPSDALNAALEIQRNLQSGDSPLKVRMSVHTGEVQLRGQSNYVGITINRAARIRSLGHGGQVLLSQASHELVSDQPPDSVTFKDMGLHRLKDLSRPERLYQLVHPDLRHDFPPLKSLDSLPNNLPAQRTTFIGRLQELQDLEQLMASTRLLTLSGAGGAGKTRLALQLGAELLDEFQDGVWFVPLASIEGDDAIAGHVAAAVGLGESQKSLLPTFIGSKKMLLILDNSEHVIQGSTDLTMMVLDGCPGLKIVVTSREPLGIDGETTYRVPSLSLPEPRAELRIDALQEFEAIQLFVERASKARPNFKVTEDNAQVVTAICERLNGIPLAIELAAARIRVLSPAQILDGLSDRFRLLTGSARSAVPRQQTLRASVDWSHNLLDETERKALRRLSVFPASFDLDAAESVASSEDLDRLQVLDVLTQLVDKSLVVASEFGPIARYSLLETIRQYAHERLVEATEDEQTRLSHRDHYLTWIRHVAELAEGTWEDLHFDLESALASDDFANCESAIAWSLDRGEGNVACEFLTYGLPAVFLSQRDWVTPYFERTLSLIPEGTLERGRLFAVAATISPLNKELIPYGVQSVDLLRSFPENEAGPFLAAALYGVGGISYVIFMDRPKARGLIEEAIEMADKYGPTYWAVMARGELGYLKSLEGEVDEGLAEMRAAVDSARKTNNAWLLSYSLFGTGLAHYLAGRPEEALPFYEEAIPLMRRGPSKLSLQWALDHISKILFGFDRLEEARPYVDEAMRISKDYDLEQGNYWSIVQTLALLEEHEGSIDQALERLERIIRSLRATPEVEPLVNALSLRAGIQTRHELSSSETEDNVKEALTLARQLEPQTTLTGKLSIKPVLQPLSVWVEARLKTESAKAARVQGFIDSWMESNEIQISLRFDRLRQERITVLREALGPKRLEMEQQLGRVLEVGAAVAYALDEKDGAVAGALIAADHIETALKAGSTPGETVDFKTTTESLDTTAFKHVRGLLLLAEAKADSQRDASESERFAYEALPLIAGMEDSELTAACFEILAAIAANLDSFEESARLYGVSFQLKESFGRPPMPAGAVRVKDSLDTEKWKEAIDGGGAMSIDEAVEYALRGRGERKRPSAGWPSLTPTELRVAELVGEGLTNPQIAERLFVSKRTVQSHLYNIFSKLGLETRAKLASEVTRRRT